MKKIITYILPSLLLCLSATAQDNATPDKGAVLASSGVYEFPKAENVSTRWKEERVSQRREFYAAKTAFDPSAEYETLYRHSASSTLTQISEKGNVKLMEGNNKAQIAYYNNAVVGTILKLTNPNNGKSTYAIVVGKIPPAQSESYTLVLSEKVARNLDVKEYASIELTCYSGQER